MSKEPIIVFGQQPCGFFPKRFLVSKIWTAQRLRSEIGGRIVFFYHDCDHDYRETQTVLRHRKTGEAHSLNFVFDNKIQKKFSPLCHKRVSPGWKEKTVRQLPNYVEPELVELFASVEATNVADFCLEMYRGMGLLDGVEVVRSGDRAFRESAIDIEDYFVDATWKGEVVRARKSEDCFVLHRGGNAYETVEVDLVEKGKVTPARDTRLRWMQSVLHCSHYVCGASEKQYLNTEETPEISFVTRDDIERSGEAYVGD